MRLWMFVRWSVVALLLGAAAGYAQDGRQGRHGWQGKQGQLMWRLTQDDVLLPITSVEWGAPDRWSFTSRYVHLFTQGRDGKPGPTWVHGFTATLSPGTDGGRLGIGYSGVHRGRVPLLPEVRLTLLRTWGHPLEGRRGQQYVGPELRLCVGGIATMGVGWYRATASVNGRKESFWGFHVGVGM